MKYTQSQLDEIALSTEEYQLIVSKLGRDPNYLELGLFGALWSEHCGYKHSKNLIKTLTNSSSALLAKPGEENAGVIDIGNNLAIVFKIESHNHPSAVEPYQGAATGVGGIIRDILAMGARPVAILNSLRFGYINTDRSEYLFEGIVSGISGYGNCIGIPNIGGETKFSHYGISIKPEIGKTIIWPAEWPHAHSGEILNSGKKYIVTGWWNFVT